MNRRYYGAMGLAAAHFEGSKGKNDLVASSLHFRPHFRPCPRPQALGQGDKVMPPRSEPAPLCPVCIISGKQLLGLVQVWK